MEAKQTDHNGNLACIFYLPREEAAELDAIADALQVRRANVLRSIVHATLEKLTRMDKPPSTLGGIENAIIGTVSRE